MPTVTVHLLKPGKGTEITYPGELLAADDEYLLVHARWTQPPLNLGYVVFETGDHFYEYYYLHQWFNIFVLRSDSGTLKGWYCNVARPALVEGDAIYSEDLEIDVFVSADRQQVLALDLDEFEARGFARSDPATEIAARASLEQLTRLARAGTAPFDVS